MHSAHLAEQREVGHVAGADPKDVRVAGDHLQVARIEHLGDERHVEFLACLGEQLHALLAESLEGVGAGSGLERISPENGRTRLAHRLGRPKELFSGLDGTRTGDRGEHPSPDLGVPNLDDRVVGLKVA